MSPVLDNSSTKRKWEDTVAENFSDKPSKARSKISIFNTEINLETPLPSEWQRCLDIKSGQVYCYNTRTKGRISRGLSMDNQEEPPTPGGMSLDLELKLPCGSAAMVKNYHLRSSHLKPKSTGSISHNSSSRSRSSGGIAAGILPWLKTLTEGDQKEMVAAVCRKCNMLVMMCKSSPACPNCKFMHPLYESLPNLLKGGLNM